jgi:hypothetical protein
MGTCQPERLEWLKYSVSFLDAQSFPFSKKHLIIDQFSGLTFPADMRADFESSGWNIIPYSVGGGRDGFGRAICMIDALKKIDSDFIFYNEDDILARMPRIDDVLSILDRLDGERRCGMLSMNIGGSDHDFPNKKFGDLLEIQNNALLTSKDYVAFKRLEHCASRWFVEFPGLFARRDMLLSILEPTFGNGGLEIHMTEKYFRSGFDKKFFKVSICKPNVFEVVDFYKSQFNPEKFESAKMIRLLDRNQGDALFNLNDIPEI